jgi:hypothetical protein
LRNRVGLVLGIVAIVVVVVGGALGYLGAGLAVAAGERTAANGVMRSAGADTLKLSGAFVNPKDSGASSQNDIGQAKSQIDQTLARYQQGKAVLTADVAGLQRSNDRLLADENNLLLLPQRSWVEQQRHTVNLALSGFGAGRTWLALGIEQLQFMSALFDSMNDYVTAMNTYTDKNDLNGALAQFPQIQQKLVHATQLSHGGHIPPQYLAMMSWHTTLQADSQKMLQALHDKQYSQADAAANQVDSDAKGFTFDENGFSAYEDKLFNPLKDAYNNNLKAAGFQLQA